MEQVKKQFPEFPDDRIYLSIEELAANTGRKAKEITAREYASYLLWNGAKKI